MSLDSVVERADQQDEQENADLPKFTQEELEAFAASRVWKRLVHDMLWRVNVAQNVRDKEQVTRDSERLHLGVVIGIKMCLNWVQQTLDNHKQTQTERNNDE